ncbi:MAG: sodium:calcium antiporter, partial [Candidatus Cloacimonetes bacterium]|nr:sodium:calcium antiporter [Candidatus Cloacimonadota bacterium]
EEHPEVNESNTFATWKSIIIIAIGSVGLFFGGDWVVESAVYFANIFGWSQSFIGLTVVALGTSLPELVTSIIAASKREVDIAVGNVVGSNIFNLLLILGFSSIIKPLRFAVVSNEDIAIVLLASILMLVLILIGRKRDLNRWKGVVFLLGYIAYIVYLFYRDSHTLFNTLESQL